MHCFIGVRIILIYTAKQRSKFNRNQTDVQIDEGDVIGTNSFKELFLNDFWGTPMSDASSLLSTIDHPFFLSVSGLLRERKHFQGETPAVLY
ncbi:unnamed protein product [Parnassius apollo]|uniref:(apollo) hypothetical protein n=1 Tax=Parnassius apollo TaxID=110799 RepID=A0A8S3W3L8_PARAO|nr:unnamed protein product [Parnassius apollo]